MQPRKEQFSPHPHTSFQSISKPHSINQVENNMGKKKNNKGKYKLVDRVSDMLDSAENKVCQSSRSIQDKNECNLGKSRRRRGSEVKRLGKNEKNKGVFNLVDRISAVPDEILVSILSLLPLKEAAATSILSRRWQYVWTSTLSLNFDVNFHLRRITVHFNYLTKELRHLEIDRYVNWVNHVLAQHRGPKLEKFRVCFELNSHFASSIDKWIQFAMEKGVQKLELEFHLIDSLFSKCFYTFPHKILGLKKEHLYSYTPSLRSCGYYAGFQFLKVLNFQSVSVTDEVLEYFLSNCTVLERLSLVAIKSLANLRVVGPVLALKYLVVQFCIDLQNIEIRDAKLISFSFADGTWTNLLLSNVPMLVDVSIEISRCLSIVLPFRQLSCCFSQLEILTVDITGTDFNWEYEFPTFANLKHLEIEVIPNGPLSLRPLMYYLKASPFLQRLVYKMRLWLNRRDGRDLEKADEYHPHHHLKVVEISGYRAHKHAVGHVMYLIKSAPALEKIVIDPVERVQYPSESYPSEMDRAIEDVIEEVQAREHAMQHLKRKMPSNIEFVCL